MQFLDINGVKRFKQYTDDTFITSEDISTVEESELDFYTKSEIDALLENIETGTANLATVATTGSYNDLTDKPTIPSIDSTPTSGSNNVVTSGGIKTALDKKIQYGAAILSNNTFATNNRLYITKIDNSLYGAAQRYNVTHKYYNATDDSLLGNVPNTTNLFNCDYEVTSKLVKDGTYAELYIGKVAEADLGSTSSYLWTYGAGEIYCSFYSNFFPSSISAKVYCRAHTSSGQTAGWYDLTVTQVSTNVYKLAYPSGSGTTYTTAFKIKYGGRTIGSYGASLCEVEMYRTRAAVSDQAVVTKYPIPQEMLGNLTAPAFIKKGGTSSQFLKADGSVDTNTYALASSVPAAQVQSDWNATTGMGVILNKPTIPAAITESTVSGWGFTKNTGTLTSHAEHKLLIGNPTQSPQSLVPGQTVDVVVSLAGTSTATSGDLTITPTLQTIYIPNTPGTLNTNNTTSQTASSSESLSGTINLHKISKTGSYSDLIDAPINVSDFVNDCDYISAETPLSKGTTSGSGNAVTDISVSGHQITLTKGTTFLTSHQDISGKANLSGAAFTGAVTGTSSGNTAQFRNVTISSSEPTASDGSNGDIWIVI